VYLTGNPGTFALGGVLGERRLTVSVEGTGNGARPRERGSRAWYWLLLLPLVGTLIPTIYNNADPTFIGIPFFYWYQMGWIFISVICTVVVYRKTRG
jgi:Protein of unknown function (DUF3311)